MVTSSEFRKDLFNLLEKAVHGETVEVSYKGAVLKIVAGGSGNSKLARARKRNILAVPPKSIVRMTDELQSFEAEWAKEASEL